MKGGTWHCQDTAFVGCVWDSPQSQCGQGRLVFLALARSVARRLVGSVTRHVGGSPAHGGGSNFAIATCHLRTTIPVLGVCVNGRRCGQSLSIGNSKNSRAAVRRVGALRADVEPVGRSAPCCAVLRGPEPPFTSWPVPLPGAVSMIRLVSNRAEVGLASPLSLLCVVVARRVCRLGRRCRQCWRCHHRLRGARCVLFAVRLI